MRYRLRTLLIIWAIGSTLIGLALLYWKPLAEFIVDDVLMRGIP
jgi:hypothetical protein